MWTPAFYQYRLGKNSKYLNSVWLGTVWAFLSLPELLLFMWLLPIFDRPSTFFGRTRVTLLLILKLPILGLLGGVTTEDVSVEEVLRRLQSVQ
ncbi:hypothetical protein WS84_28250 [Burkholderia anthina]|nr:hypothetical protein WS84_28250 [Burkholderia anthina]